MGFKLNSDLNGGESPYSFPSTIEELATAGFCPECAATIPLAHYSVCGKDYTGSQLPAFTEDEINESLSQLEVL